MNTWHERAMELNAQGLTKREIAKIIESEFGLTGMYNTVKSHIYRRLKKIRGAIPAVIVSSARRNRKQN